MERHEVPFVGDRAPRTVQALIGNPTVPAEAIDSRAIDNARIPDPELHNTTIAAALDAHRPLMVVIATPTYCTSRFCGPITDAVARLAARYGDRMDFVHLEIWADFDTQTINDAVRDWIFPPGAEDAREPWVFIVGRDGRVRDRFDNVATEDELDAAVQAAIQA